MLTRLVSLLIVGSLSIMLESDIGLALSSLDIEVMHRDQLTQATFKLTLTHMDSRVSWP